MSDETTPKLGLPLLHAAQAQKELTHNEALIIIDTLLAGVCAAEPANTPPATPQNGSLWIAGAMPTGVWAGKAHQIALWTLNGWRFVQAPIGTQLRFDDGRPIRRTAEGWEVGIIEANFIRIGGHIVLGSQQNAIAPPVDGTVVDSQARTAIQSILGVLSAHGLTAHL